MFTPNFRISPKVLNNIARIEALKEKLESSRILPKQEIALKRRANIRMAQGSTSIEGNLLNEVEVEMVFANKPTNASLKDEQEVRNYQRAIAFINKTATDNKSLNKSIVLQAHKILMADLLSQEKVGRFRKAPVYIVNAYKTHDELVYTAPPASKVPALVTAVFQWLAKTEKEKLSPIIQAGILHHELALIHPFADGNGRVARLLTMFHLYARDYAIKKIYTLDSYYNQDRHAYYQAIHSGSDYEKAKKRDLTPWLEYFTQGFVSELQRISDQVSALKIGAGETVFLEKDLLRIIDFVASVGRITSADVEEILKVSKRTAQLKLKMLVDQEILRKTGKGPNTHFELLA